MAVQLKESWIKSIGSEFDKPYFNELKSFLKNEKSNGKTIYPPGKLIFSALDLLPFDEVKVVILGQDPYHGDGQAHGLSFSVPDGFKIPPSLRNIYKELESDLGTIKGSSGDLSNWAKQGVLLLNAVLTVEKSKAGSHKKKGWENFTDKIIKTISEQRNEIVFILWGNYARAKTKLIDSTKHLIIESPHPSPFSAHTGFLGSKPFSKTNTYLKDKGIAEIIW